MSSNLPLQKRIKLDPSASPSPSPDAVAQRQSQRDGSQSSVTLGKESADGDLEVPMVGEEEEDPDHCVICLHHIQDRTVLPCAHDRLCFECILLWTAQSRKCPLCNAPIGPYLIHNLRSKYDYQKYYLPPLRTSPPPSRSSPQPLLRGGTGTRGRSRLQTPRWGTRARDRSVSRERREMADELELAVERRRWVYRHSLYAKHVASNPYSRYRPAPTPAQISASPDLISRATIFVRRELRVWVNLDVEFLTTFIISLMKTLDLRSESAVKLLAEFLDMDTPYHVGDPEERPCGRFRNAEHFAHELYSYLRSPFRDLATYDSVVQYDIPLDVPPAPSLPPTGSHRWDTHARSPTQGEPSSRRRRRSSPSPLSRSPRDVYSRSRSPASSRSHNESRHYRPLPPSRSPGHAHSRAGAFENDTERQWLNRNTEGKGKSRESTHPTEDTGARVWGGGGARQGRSSRRSMSPRRSPTQLGSRREPFTTGEKRRRRSPSNASESSRHGTRQLVSHEGHPTPSDGDSQTASNDKLQPQSMPATSEGVWGISIKGQAKHHTKSPKSNAKHRELLPDSSKNPRAVGVSTARTRNSISLDVLHAHLGRSSTARESGTQNTFVGSDKIDDATRAHRDTAITQDNRSPLAHSSADTQRPSLLPSVGEPSSSTTPSSRSLPSQTSAPEIMARTRARLARLKAQPALTDVTLGLEYQIPSETLAGKEARGTSQSSFDMRARLVERLEEERKKVPQLQGGHGSSLIGQSSNALKGRRMISPERNALQNGEGEQSGVSLESQQAESKLRAHALLRVRLTAEKRQAEVRLNEASVMSREEALRATLLSRRT